MHAAALPDGAAVAQGDVVHGAELCALAAAYALVGDAEGPVLDIEGAEHVVYDAAAEPVHDADLRVGEGPAGGDLTGAGLYAGLGALDYGGGLGAVGRGEHDEVVFGHDGDARAHVLHAYFLAEAAAVLGGVAGFGAAGEVEIQLAAALPPRAAEHGLDGAGYAPGVSGHYGHEGALRREHRGASVLEPVVERDDLVAGDGGDDARGIQAVARAGKAEYHMLSSFAPDDITKGRN